MRDTSLKTISGGSSRSFSIFYNYTHPKIAQSCANHSVTLEESEKGHIIEALNTTGWRVSGKALRVNTAEILDIKSKTLERGCKDWASKETSPIRDSLKAANL